MLEAILDAKRKEIENLKQTRPLDELVRKALSKIAAPRFGSSIDAPGLSLIGEYKRASPSKGTIRTDLAVEEVARAYEQAGAAAMSVVTESVFFKGDAGFVPKARAAAKLPLLMKDFIIDEYQIYYAKLLGASAVLLIAAALTTNKLSAFVNLARRLGLDALVEVHDKRELDKAMLAGAAMVGVNNRDLSTFHVDLATAELLTDLIPRGVRKVAESGINSAADARRMADAGYHAVLVGEALMRAPGVEDMKDMARGFIAAGVAS